MQSGCFGLASRRFFFIFCCLQKPGEIFRIHPNTTLSPILPRRYLFNSLLSAQPEESAATLLSYQETHAPYMQQYFLFRYGIMQIQEAIENLAYVSYWISYLLFSVSATATAKLYGTRSNTLLLLIMPPWPSGGLRWMAAFAGLQATRVRGETEANIGPLDPLASCLSIKQGVWRTSCLEEFDGNWMCFAAP